jgi:hypothetical protein
VILLQVSFDSAVNSQQMLTLFPLLLALLCCVARAETQPTASPEAQTGLEGSITLRNIAGGPVRVGVPNEKPLANITFVVKMGDTAVGSFTTDEQGRFRISLPPGHYSVSRKDWKSAVGFYGPFEVEVAGGVMKNVHWNCDTGLQ